MANFLMTTTTPHYIGASTDTKPTEQMVAGMYFKELDTKKLWIYSEKNINPSLLSTTPA